MRNKTHNRITILIIVLTLLFASLSNINADISVLNAGDNSAKEILVGVENAYVDLDWRQDELYGSNSTVTDETGYYKMNLPKGEADVSASLKLVRNSETIFVYNSTGDFDVDGDPCCYWKNFTLPNNFPSDNATITGYVYNESNHTEKIQADISISFSSYPESNTGFRGYNTTLCNISGGYKIHLPSNVEVEVTATAPGYWSCSTWKRIEEEEVIIPDLFLSPKPVIPPDTAVVKGYVKDVTTGNGINAAIVEFGNGTFGFGNASFTDSDGYYEINLPALELDVWSMVNGYFCNITSIQINSGETRWLNLSHTPLSDNAWVHVYVNNSENGSSISNAYVTVSGEYYLCVNFSLPASEWKFAHYTKTLTTYNEIGGYYNVSVPAIIINEDGSCFNYSYVYQVSVSADGYYDNMTDPKSGGFDIEPGDVKNVEINLDPKPEENCTVQGYVYMVKHCPEANNDSYTTNEDTTLTIAEPGILGNDSDVDGDTLTAILVDSVSNGTLTLNSNGSFTYTPKADFYGTDRFTYNVTDGNCYSNIATVNITIIAINDPPVISYPNPVDADTDVFIGLSELNVTIEDPEDDSFNWSIETSPNIGSNNSNDEYDGIKTCSLSGLDYGTSYTWYVNASDAESGKSTDVTYLFTTESLNNPPCTPRNPSPPDEDTDVGINTNLGWDGGDPDTGDTVTYDVYFGTCSPPPKVKSNQSGTSYNPGTMNYNTNYHWKIIAWDEHGAMSAGPVWSFTTMAEPNDPPVISDPNPVDADTDVSIGLSELNITIEDSDGNNFDWSIKTSPNIGSSNGSDESNGIKTCSIYNLQFNTIYTWYVNATDIEGSGITSRKVYTFTTRQAKLNLTMSFPKKICLASVDAKIKNTGEKDISNINWSISVKGGLFGRINVAGAGHIETLNLNEVKKISTWGSGSRIVRRFGRVNITVEATADDETFSRYADGFVIGRILLLL